MTYQDIYVNGQIRAKGERECASRYEAIREALNRYSRPFSVLDIGAAQGYFSFRILEDFPEAAVVAIDQGKHILELCEESDSDLIHLQRRISAEELTTMSECEQFDVVLALNVLHHFPGAQWRQAYAAIKALGQTIIMETPPPDDVGACGQGVIPEIWRAVADAPQIASTPSHTSSVDRPMYQIMGNAPKITRSYVDVDPGVHSHFGSMGLTMTLDEARVTFHRKGVTRDWIPGLNLRTWQRLGGVWPGREHLAGELSAVSYRGLDEADHGDLNPWNIILTRDGCRLIDGKDEDPGRAIYEDDIESLIQEVCG